MDSFRSLPLPPSIIAKAEMSPVEDLILAIMRDDLPDLPVFSLVLYDQRDLEFFATFRRVPLLGQWNGDPRFIDSALLSVQVFCKDPNADDKAAVISEAIRVTFRDAALKQVVYPEIGHLVKARMTAEPTRRPDWASATGPVQYADLPVGYYRYESQYTIKIRRAL